MKILITGGTGFLGKKILEKKSEHEFFIISRNKLNFNVQCPVNVIRCDLSEEINERLLPSKLDGIIHLVQSLNYKNFPNSANEIFNINVSSTAFFLEYARKCKANFFINASTGSIYSPSKKLVNEKVLPNVSGNFYAASKLASEQLVNAYSNYFNVVNLRFYGLYGPNLQKDKFLFKIINQMRNKKTIILNNSSLEKTKFQFTYVDDAVKVLNCAISDKWNGTTNIASDEIISLNTILNEISKRLDVKPVIKLNKIYKNNFFLADITRLKQLMPHIKFTKFQEGISYTIDTI